MPARVLDDIWAADRKAALQRLGALVRAARRAGVRVSPLLVEGPPPPRSSARRAGNAWAY